LSDSDLFKKKHKNEFDSDPSNQLKEITDCFKELDKLLYKDNRITLHVDNVH